MNQNIGQLLTRRAYRDPKLEAVYDAGNGKRFSYSQLNANSNRTANAFTDLGLNKGDVVGLLLHNSVEYLESFFAAAKSGLIVVPLNWRLVADELVFILNDAGVKLLLFSDDFSEVASELRRRNTTGITHWIQVDGDPDSPPTMTGPVGRAIPNLNLLPRAMTCCSSCTPRALPDFPRA